MDGFKNSTKTQYSMGGYAKGGSKGTAKVGKVMGEFKAGTLHSGSKKGPEVTNPKQAIAIGLSEARKAGAKFPVKKQAGGAISDAARRQLEAEMNDMNPADRTRALKMLGRAPAAVVKKTTTVVAPLPKKTALPAGMTEAQRRMVESEMNDVGYTGYKKGGSVKAANALRAQKYKAAMASRPNREPKIPVKDPAKVQLAASAIKGAIEKAISTRAAQQPAPQAASPMEAAAPPMMGVPAMKKGGMADLKQDKATVKVAVHKHEAAMHPGKPMTKLRKGGMPC